MEELEDVTVAVVPVEISDWVDWDLLLPEFDALQDETCKEEATLDAADEYEDGKHVAFATLDTTFGTEPAAAVTDDFMAEYAFFCIEGAQLAGREGKSSSLRTKELEAPAR